MKRFTLLTMLVTLLNVTTFAQNDLVTPPEGLETDEWAISAVTNFGNPVNGYLYIGFDGNDVYLKGLCTYLPEAWIQGTLDGNTITFPGDQYFGFYDESVYTHYNFFLCSQGIVFTYDADAGKLTAEGETFIYTGGSSLKGDVYNNPVVMKVTEKAAKPANPYLEQVYNTDICPVVTFNVSTVDVDGNGMASSKLTFKFLKDVEEEISDVVFDADDYIYLTESLTQLPYGINDGLGNEGEFNPKYIHLKQKDFNTWNKLGLQSIYTGGGEENKSDIIWLDIKPYEKTSFDFNAMEVICSSNESHDGDITEDCEFAANKVKLTVSPNSKGTPNCFWSTENGPQLRVYGGTMTFEAPVGKVITKLVFDNDQWNEGNSADSGAFDGNVWTGEAKKVVVTVAGSTQLNSIVVYPTDDVPTAVEAPEGMSTATYTFQAHSVKPYYEPAELTLWVKAGFAGDDVFIQGLASDVDQNAGDLWVKATKNEAGKYVIPANQFMGSIQVWMSSMDFFFTAVDADGNMVDAVFDFDAEKSQFTTAQTLVINASLTELNPQQTFTNAVLTKFNEVAATPIEPTIINLDFDEWTHCLHISVPNVGTNGEVLNPDKLYYTVWIEENGEQKPYTFTAEMYYFEEDVTEAGHTFCYNPYDNTYYIYFYDDTEVFSRWTKVGAQSIYYGAGECNKSQIAWVENPTAGINNVSADVNTGKAVIFNLAGQRLDAPQKGINIINGRKVVMK